MKFKKGDRVSVRQEDPEFPKLGTVIRPEVDVYTDYPRLVEIQYDNPLDYQTGPWYSYHFEGDLELLDEK